MDLGIPPQKYDSACVKPSEIQIRVGGAAGAASVPRLARGVRDERRVARGVACGFPSRCRPYQRALLTAKPLYLSDIFTLQVVVARILSSEVRSP